MLLLFAVLSALQIKKKQIFIYYYHYFYITTWTLALIHKIAFNQIRSFKEIRKEKQKEISSIVAAKEVI
jgi:hypothetical protein